jgi:hypothetical protein
LTASVSFHFPEPSLLHQQPFACLMTSRNSERGIVPAGCDADAGLS